MSDSQLYGLSGLILGCLAIASYIHLAAIWIAKDYTEQGMPYAKAYWKTCLNLYKFSAAVVGMLVVIGSTMYGVSQMGGLQNAVFNFLKWVLK